MEALNHGSFKHTDFMSFLGIIETFIPNSWHVRLPNWTLPSDPPTQSETTITAEPVQSYSEVPVGGRFSPEELGRVVGRRWCCKDSGKHVQMVHMLWIWAQVASACTFRSAPLNADATWQEDPELLRWKKLWRNLWSYRSIKILTRLQWRRKKRTEIRA